jgi:hypothetical protein
MRSFCVLTEPKQDRTAAIDRIKKLQKSGEDLRTLILKEKFWYEALTLGRKR